MKMKKCSGCLQEFPETREFFWKKLNKFAPQCVECGKKYNKYSYEKHREPYLSQKKEAYSLNKDEMRQRGRNQYLKNREKRLKQQKEYCLKNKEILRPKNAARAIKRYRSDIQQKIKSNLSSRMRQLFKKNGSRTVDFIGCSIDELKQHLENQFLPGMSWDNYGLHGWHVDHIKPCTKFDLSDPEQQKACFHYTNLQPLWAIDNIKKSNKWEPPILSNGESR